MQQHSLVWFRKDLRLSDNPALHSVAAKDDPTLLLFILDTQTEGALPVGGAAAWWLHHSLTALAKDIAEKGGRLILRRGDPQAILSEITETVPLSGVAWNRCYEPDAIARDTALKTRLKDKSIPVESFNGSLLHEPWTVQKKTGGPYGVFTPFWKAELALEEPAAALPPPNALLPCSADIPSDSLDDWGLLPAAPNWASDFPSYWTPGEAGARDRLSDFLEDTARDYDDMRNRPDIDGTSRLSPHLAFGEVSPREIWHIARDRLRKPDGAPLDTGVWSFLREIGWRDFNHNLLFHNPTLPTKNHDKRFDVFPWSEPDHRLTAWQRGQTGYPIVDAGMRELWATGYMHNRVRMIVASFLIKHLLLDWRHGEAWFRDTLLDADLANNTTNWQWTAGCGADAAPYFRIFNPITQGDKFDPEGVYVRKWVPELAKMPKKFLNKPWEAPTPVLHAAGVTLGKTYPKPLVDHAAARARALDAFAEIKGAA